MASSQVQHSPGWFLSRPPTRRITMTSIRETVRISVPVSPEAAAALGDEDRLREVGQLVSALVLRAPVSERELPVGSSFMDVLMQIRADAAASGLTDPEVDAELAEWKRERASRRR